MFAFSKGTPHFQPSLFDIRVYSANRNILLLQGLGSEANSVILSGHVVFSLPKPVTLRAVSLDLAGYFKLDFLESFQDDAGHTVAACPVRRESEIVKVVWRNLLTDPKGEIVKIGLKDEGKPKGGGASVTQLASMLSSTHGKPIKHVVLDKDLPAGVTPFAQYAEQGDTGVSFHLPEGNYSLPFEVILPGDIPETVEGLRCGVMLYRLKSLLLGSKQFKKEPRAFKYLRIFRQRQATEVALSEDCLVENTWPGKIQYEVRLPHKAIALGGKTKIHIMVVPLMKGLQLGRMTASIQQYFALRGDEEESFEDEKTIYKCHLPPVSMDRLSPDRWKLAARITVPNDLKLCTPDVELKEDLIRVRHRLVLDLNIINPDGHTSQVKSKLPIILCISGNEPLLGRNVYVDHNGRVRFKAGTSPIFSKLTAESGVVTPTAGTFGTSSSAARGSTTSLHNTLPSSSSHRRPENDNELITDDPDSSESEEPVFLPSYKDSEKDVHLDPELVSPLISPMVSPMPVIEESGGGYFDLDPMALRRSTQAMSPGPMAQFISKVNSEMNTPIFDVRANEVPPYSSVYDDDFSVSADPAPPYQASSADVSDRSEVVSVKSEVSIGSGQRVGVRSTPLASQQGANSSTSSSEAAYFGMMRSQHSSSAPLMPELHKTLSSTLERPRSAVTTRLFKNLSSDNLPHKTGNKAGGGPLPLPERTPARAPVRPHLASKPSFALRLPLRFKKGE